MISIALLGRPNVGKSSLFNRLARERIAITSDISGTTRDTQSRIVDIQGRECVVVDTGGLDESSALFEKVKEKSLQSAQKSDIILYIVDGKFYPDEDDRKLFHSLTKLGKPIALIVNKIDNDNENERAWEFGSFGADILIPISVSHNRGTIALKNWLLGFLPPLEDELVLSEDEDDFMEEFVKEEEEELVIDDEKDDFGINIGIIGRVNVGKSSLLNALVGEERAVVSDIGGTTIDPVDEAIFYNEKLLNFVDTAGLRRRGKIEGIERYALNRTQAILEKTDIALLVLDASEPFTELDERIAGMVEKFELACIIVLNKWDKADSDFKKSIENVRDRFKFLFYAPIITVSALSNKRVPKVLDLILKVYENYSRRIPTSKINKLLRDAVLKHPIPSDKGKLVKIYFATQFDICPPRIALVMNRPHVLHFSYKRYIMNQLRENVELDGAPLVLIPRKRNELDPDDEEALKNILLIGFMGVGKSTIAKAFSAKTGIFSLDTDDLIESFENRTIKDIFSKNGEDYFRKCESRTAKWLSKSVKNTIVATGGGFFMADGFEKAGTIIYLKSSFDSILKQLFKNQNSKDELAKRPLFQDITKAKTLFEARTLIYEKKANIILDVENKSVDEIVDALIKTLNIS